MLERTIESAGWLRVEHDILLKSRVLRLSFACMLERSFAFHECVVDGLRSEIRSSRAFGDLAEALWKFDGATGTEFEAEASAGVCRLPVESSPECVRIVWRLEQFVTRESGIPRLIADLGGDISDTCLGPLTRSWIRNRQNLSFADSELRDLYMTSEIWSILSSWLVADMQEAASALLPVDVHRMRERARKEARHDLVTWWDSVRSIRLPGPADFPDQLSWGDLLSSQ